MRTHASLLAPVLWFLFLTGCPTEPGGDTASVTTVDVSVFKRDPATGCWATTTEHWPEEYWSDQASSSCAEDDIERYFQRGEHCYRVGGSCSGWFDDPEVTLCEPSSESCCGSEDECASE